MSALVTAGSDALPDPFYSQQARAPAAWGYEVDVVRLQNSDTWALCPRKLRAYLLAMWVLPWSRVPAGTYPNDDAVVADVIGLDVATLRKHRDVFMRGWTLCSDGRLYHPECVAQVQRMHKRRAKWAGDKERARGQSVTTETTNQPLASDVQVESTGTLDGLHLPPVPIPVPITKRQEQRQTDAPSEPVPVNGKHSPAVDSARGTRFGPGPLPDDWRDWCKATHPELDPDDVYEDFSKFWQAKAGVNATKRSWPLTWQVWCKREARERKRNPRRDPMRHPKDFTTKE